MKRVIIPLLFGLLFALLAPAVLAQSEEPTPALTGTPPPPETPQASEDDIPLIHAVEAGETLSSIAELYGTTIELLQQLNSIEDPSLLYVGQELLIPGGGGDLVATVHIVQVGETVLSLATAYSSTVQRIAADNRMVSYDNLIAGQSINILSRTGTTAPIEVDGLSYVVQPGDTLSSIAVKYSLLAAEILDANQLPFPGYLIPNQRLLLPINAPYQPLPGTWSRVMMTAAPLFQGESAALYVESRTEGVPSGTIAGQELRFFPNSEGYLALFGLDAFTQPGTYQLELRSDGESSFSQFVQVLSGNYGTQIITIPAELEELLAPEVRAADEAIMAPVFLQSSDLPMWTTQFTLPVQDVPISAGYGASRSYNEGPIEIFHTGVDFAGAIGTPILSPADGTVVFSDTLPLHGNTLILDHGLGVMTAYYHLSQIQVLEGDLVSAGQQIASGGSTGLSSGPHLHWDLRIHNVPVNGLQWVEEDLIGQILERPLAENEPTEDS